MGSMTVYRVLLAVLIATFAQGCGIGAVAAHDAACEYDLANVPNAPRFADYLAPTNWRTHPARPLLDSHQARLFRTVIRDAAAQGPNFAGNDTVAVWGCGASCTSAAIVDARSGRVFFPAAISDIAGNHVAGRDPDGAEPAFNSLRFRPDSRLLAVLGAPGEDESREGVSFFVWTGAALQPLRFIPRASLCGAPG